MLIERRSNRCGGSWFEEDDTYYAPWCFYFYHPSPSEGNGSGVYEAVRNDRPPYRVADAISLLASIESPPA